MKKTTIKDVAQVAGVSVSTVSRVLSKNKAISDETCKIVMEAVEKLHYMPNTAARSLRCEKSHSIGVVFPDMAGEFYAGCASAILKQARKKDYTVLFIESGHDEKSEKEGIRALLERCVDGVIFIGDNNDASLVYEVKSRSIPVVTGDRKLCGIPSVTFDNRSTVYELVSQYCRMGYKSLVYVGEPTQYQNNLSERYMGFSDAVGQYAVMAEAVFDESLHIDKLKGGYELFEREIASLNPDLIVTSNDLIAQGIIRAAHDMGKKVPQDVAVTGFDDMLSSAYQIPSLTTIRQDIGKFCENCFGLLEKLIEGEEAESVVIGQEIIIRESAPKEGEG